MAIKIMFRPPIASNYQSSEFVVFVNWNYTHCLHAHLQSAYLELHSTETALMEVQNNILYDLDNGNCVILIMLDLSAACDTMDHRLLLSILSTRFGISRKALSWLEPYLTGRIQCVTIDGVKSIERELVCGVLQGSALVSSYKVPVGDVVYRYGLTHHVC